MLSTQTFFFFPTAPFILFVFTASTIFHLHQRLEKMQPTWELEALQPATTETPSRPQPGPQLKGMWTINAIGRLGNQMGEYATLRPSTYVGVHVRRGDYVHVMPNVWKGVVADRRYLEQALDWFRARYSAPIFVVSSNGMAWCRENINASRGDVVFAGNGNEGSPAKDFALLTQCNHTVMTIGTFGIWAAYLAGGETIYLANYTLPDSPFLKVFKPEAAFLPEWIGIPADLSPLLKH
ncbi:FUT2 [Cervus elaphus hippelaphus]|uniref:L-Fucosyltransferase n=1 Tax=Cervus elaphus hippelaphus TaxID=46360 RepID=A0A212DBQ8_CEREH|nr:FUT2 [Cervus elaphus hippelaphus]